MPPKRKKGGATGDAAKGEKIFKNLCSACHSLSVTLQINYNRLILQVQHLEDYLETTLHLEKGLIIRQHYKPRLL